MTPEQRAELEDLLTDAGPNAVLVYVDARSIRQLLDEADEGYMAALTLKCERAALKRVKAERDAAVEWIRVVIEEIAIDGGFRNGDRDQTLENIRVLIGERNRLLAELDQTRPPGIVLQRTSGTIGSDGERS